MIQNNTVQINQKVKRIFDNHFAAHEDSCGNLNLLRIILDVKVSEFDQDFGLKVRNKATDEWVFLKGTDESGFFSAIFKFRTGVKTFTWDVSMWKEYKVYYINRGTYDLTGDLLITPKTSLPSVNPDEKGLEKSQFTARIYDTIFKFHQASCRNFNIAKLDVDLKSYSLYLTVGLKVRNKPTDEWVLINGLDKNGISDDLFDFSTVDKHSFMWDVSMWNEYQCYYISRGVYELTGDLLLTSETSLPSLQERSAFETILDRKDFKLEKWIDGPPSNKTDVYNNLIAWQESPNIVKIADKGVDVSNPIGYFTVDDTYFPGLGSAIMDKMFILPYSRNNENTQPADDWRLFVIMSDGKIYHNFPNRTPESGKPDGVSLDGDISVFEESVIWDLPTSESSRKLPSKDTGATGLYRYDPTLKDFSYEFHPILNSDGSFVDTYGNGGFADSIVLDSKTFPRFYNHSETIINKVDSPFRVLSYPTKDDKLCLFGTYQTYAQRICVLASSDGGRQWFVKYEFAGSDYEDTKLSGSPIDTSVLGGDYTADSFKLNRRIYTTPTAANLEPPTKFNFEADLVVSSITRDALGGLVTTSAPHNLLSGHIVRFKDNDENGSTSPLWDFMLNDSADSLVGGTGVFYKVLYQTATTFRLLEYIHSPDAELPARHIHSINRIKDGWIVGTGENHPYGWLMYLQQGARDLYWRVLGHSQIPVTRLNSTENSVMRTTGFIMTDDDTVNPTCIHASDECFIPRNSLEITGRTGLPSRSSAGIFTGKLSDIDDFSKWKCVAEMEDVSIYMFEIQGLMIMGGMSGQHMVSVNRGRTWIPFKLPELLHVKGYTHMGEIFISGHRLTIK